MAKSVDDDTMKKGSTEDKSELKVQSGQVKSDSKDEINFTIASHDDKVCQVLAKTSDTSSSPSDFAQQLTALSIPLVKSARGRPRKRCAHDTKRGEKRLRLHVLKNSQFKEKAPVTVVGRTVEEISDPIADAICGPNNCKPYKISSSDLVALRGTGWLSDAIVNAAQFIISRQFPGLCNYQDVLLGESLTFKKRDNFIQILHIPGHWVTVTNYGAPTNSVFLYDSLDQDIMPSVATQVMNIMSLASNTLTIHAKAVQRQENCYDCGVFAIANAFTIASGVDPCTVAFDKTLMRRHLISCLADNEMVHFPIATMQVPRVKPKSSCFFVPK